MNHPARSSDPSTSHEAANYIVATGVQGDQQSAAASAVRRFPGLTSLELANETGICRYVLARRLPELAETGRVWRARRSLAQCLAAVPAPGGRWLGART